VGILGVEDEGFDVTTERIDVGKKVGNAKAGGPLGNKRGDGEMLRGTSS